MTSARPAPRDEQRPEPQGESSFASSYSRWRATDLGRITDRLEERLLVELVGPRHGLRVLDVGCGDGALAITLSRMGACATGVDPDHRMLAGARSRASAKAAILSLAQARAEALPFADATFDRVLAVTVLCFVARPDAAIAEMVRVLRPGGRIVIGELARWSIWAAVRRLRGWLGARTWRAARFRAPGELRALLERHGLTVCEVRGCVFYPPVGAAARLVARLDPWLGRRTTLGAALVVVAGDKRET